MNEWTRRRIVSSMAAAPLLCSAPALAQSAGRWRRAESAGFVVFSTMAEDGLRDIVGELESFDALLRRLTAAPATRAPLKLEIYLFSGPGQLEDAIGRRSDTIRGLYSATPEIVAAFAIYRDRYGLEAQEILFHEYAHHFMFQYFAGFYPTWYVEGFAEFVATAAFEDHRIVLGLSSDARSGWLFGGGWVPMERLIGRGLGGLDDFDVARFYAQSWLFTHYIFSTPGMAEKFQAYLHALRAGAAPVEAFTRGFGVAPAVMQATLRDYVNHSPPALALTRPAPVEHGEILVTGLPPGADYLLALSARLRGGVPEDAREAIVNRIRTSTAANDDFGRTLLARAEAKYGDPARVPDILAPLLVAPADADIPYIMGSALMRRAEAAQGEAADALRAEARRYFGRAYRLNSNHVPSLYAFAESYTGVMITEQAAENAMNALLLAHQLAPQVLEISLNAAVMLIGGRRESEAVPILRSIAHDPHGGEVAARARALLEQIEGAQ